MKRNTDRIYRYWTKMVALGSVSDTILSPVPATDGGFSRLVRGVHQGTQIFLVHCMDFISNGGTAKSRGRDGQSGVQYATSRVINRIGEETAFAQAAKTKANTERLHARDLHVTNAHLGGIAEEWMAPVIEGVREAFSDRALSNYQPVSGVPKLTAAIAKKKGAERCMLGLFDTHKQAVSAFDAISKLPTEEALTGIDDDFNPIAILEDPAAFCSTVITRPDRAQSLRTALSIQSISPEINGPILAHLIGNTQSRLMLARLYDGESAGAVRDIIGEADRFATRLMDLAMAVGDNDYRVEVVGHKDRPDLVKKEGQYAVAVPDDLLGYRASDVSVQAGGKPGISKSLELLVEPRDFVMGPSPEYPIYGSTAAKMNARYVPYVRSNGSIDFDQIEAGVALMEERGQKNRVLIVNSPHNPTGYVLTRDEMIGLAEVAAKENLVIISDEPYFNIQYSDERLSPVAFPGLRDRTVLLFTASKDYHPGLRIGAEMALPSLRTIVPSTGRSMTFIEQANKQNVNDHSGPSNLSQMAWAKALVSADALVDERVERFRERRDAIVDYLDEVGIPGVSYDEVPGGAFYFWLEVKELAAHLNLDSVADVSDWLLFNTGLSVCTDKHFSEPDRSPLTLIADAIDHEVGSVDFHRDTELAMHALLEKAFLASPLAQLGIMGDWAELSPAIARNLAKLVKDGLQDSAQMALEDRHSQGSARSLQARMAIRSPNASERQIRIAYSAISKAEIDHALPAMRQAAIARMAALAELPTPFSDEVIDFKDKSFLVVGAGPIGRTVTAKLGQSGAKVTTCTQYGFDDISAAGVKLVTTGGDSGEDDVRLHQPSDVIRRPIEFFDRDHREKAFPDFVFVTTQAGDREKLEALRPAIGPNTRIYVLENGIDPESELREMFPDNFISRCSIFVQSKFAESPSERNTVLMPKEAKWAYGIRQTPSGLTAEDFSNETSQLMTFLADDCGFENPTMIEDIDRMQWIKLFNNMGNFGSVLIYLERLMESEVSGIAPTPGTYQDVLTDSPSVEEIRNLVLEAITELHGFAVRELDERAQVELGKLAATDLTGSDLEAAQKQIQARYGLGDVELFHEMVLDYLATDHEPTSAASMRTGRNIEDILGEVIRLIEKYSDLPATHIAVFRALGEAHNQAVAVNR
ncbi:MAG: aspartate/methionine/tyrosine aminotransferase/ketopantoate reductase [Candidatus Marinamargulisbacteria bacterium]|jgi:aspartate/methionine/tyrosine aminotransferase/ketopantoate reductase